jgi:iron(III) transport system ATP-binding protein
MTVFRNVAFPLEVMKKKPSREQIRDRVEKALDLVNLGGFADRMATQLSGGQQQRLSVARALVREPSVLLLDEPLSNLDAKLRERMRGELLLIQKRVGITTLFVTHDQVEALSMSDAIAVMSGGKIVQEGVPRDIYHRPASEFVADFIGSANLIRGAVRPAADASDANLTIDTSFGVVHVPVDGKRPADGVVVAIRPEDVVVHRADLHDEGWPHGSNVFGGEVQIGLFGGTSVDYHVQLEGALIHARAASRSKMERGDRVNVELPPDALRVFELPDA